VDGARNTHWSFPGESGAVITVTFEQPTTIDRLGITPGNQDEAQTFNSARSPKEISVSLDGQPAKAITLDDNPDFQNFELGAKASTVTITVDSCYPSPQGGNDCAIAELEFFKKK
jgi:hypothetical protein